jgi:hypothetical protein
VAEAHPVDEWQLPANEEDGVLIAQHATLEERIAAAREAAARLRLTMPVLVDGMDDAASRAFAAWPERLVVADAVGVVTYPGAPGPYGFSPEEAEAALAELVAT